MRVLISALLAGLLTSAQQLPRLASDAELERQFLADRTRIASALELAQRRFDAGDFDRSRQWLTTARGVLAERRLAGLKSVPPPRVVQSSDGVLVKPPRLLNPEVRPEYPASARAAGAGALVRTLLFVEADGSVGTVMADPRSFEYEFGSLALSAIRQWRFEPALLDGKPTGVGLAAFVEFSGQNGTVKVSLPRAPVLAGYLDVVRQLADAGKIAEAEDALTQASAMIDRQTTSPGQLLARDVGWLGAPVIDPGLLEPVRILGGLPLYPADALRAGVEGEVTLSLVVSREGRVSEATAESGDARLRATAISAARHWRYVPGSAGGVLTPMRASATIRFVADGARVEDHTDSSKDIVAPRKLHDVRPVYPEDAIKSRIQGVVVIEATIGRDGRVKDTRVVRPVHPMLDEAAAAAVKQWRYTPTLLKGEPVEVIMTVTTTFSFR